MKPRLIEAFFAGTCRICSKKVAKGERVWFAKHYGIRCEACGPHTAADAPLPSKRGKNRMKPVSPSPVDPAHAERLRQAMAAMNNPPKPQDALRRSGFTPIYTPAALKGPADKGPDNVARLSWSSISELLADGAADYAQSDHARSYLSSLHRRHAEDRWANGHTVKSLCDTITTPPQELVEAVESMRQILMDEIALPVQPRRKVRRGLDWGDEIEADRFLCREPNVWERSVRETTPRHTVTIGVNLTVSCMQEPGELIYRGAAAVALADLLTQRGINVRVVGFSVGEDVSSTMYKLVSIVELKSPDMPMDIASLTAAVCEIGFFRMIVMPAEFRHLTGRVSESLGTRGYQYLPGPDRTAIDYLIESDVKTREAATAWLRQTMAALPAQEVTCG